MQARVTLPEPCAQGPPAPVCGPIASRLQEVEELAASGGPLRRAECALAGRLYGVQGIERLGFSRPRDYAVEQLGLSGRAFQEQAQIDAALQELPGLEAALVAGRLPWTKVRLVARVATPDDEERWLVLAARCSSRELSREVRAVDLGAALGAGARNEETVASGGVAVRGEDAKASEHQEEEEEEDEPRENVVLQASGRARGRWRVCHQLARRVCGEALPMWQAMEYVAAEALSALPLEPRDEERAVLAPIARSRRASVPAPLVGHALVSAASCGTASDPVPPPAALPRVVQTLMEGLDALDVFGLDRRLRAAVALEQRLLAELAPLLLVIFEKRDYLWLGITSFEAYVREHLGFSPRKGRMLLRLARAVRKCPALGQAWRTGRVSWMKAHALVPVVALGDADVPAWIAHAARVTVRRLEEDVVRAVDWATIDPAAWGHSTGRPEAAPGAPGEEGSRERQMRAHRTDSGETGSGGAESVERQTGAQHTDPGTDANLVRIFFSAPAPVARLFRVALCRVQRHLETVRGRPLGPRGAGDALLAMFEHFEAVWSARQVPPRVARAHAVFDRDGWRCRVPGCSSYRNLHDHHVRFRSQGGSDALSNRVTLCAWHHLRGVHGGRIRVHGTAPAGLTFELGLRDGRPPLLRYDSREEAV